MTTGYLTYYLHCLFVINPISYNIIIGKSEPFTGLRKGNIIALMSRNSHFSL